MELLIAIIACLMAVAYVVGAVTAAWAHNASRAIEKKLEKLEQNVLESFKEVSIDANDFEKRIQAIEHNMSVKVASVIQAVGGDGQA